MELRRYRIAGLDCADCAAKLEKKIGALAGVYEAKINFGASILTLKLNGEAKEVYNLVQQSGYSLNKYDLTEYTTSKLSIRGLDCADCAKKLEKKIQSLPHVLEVVLNFGAGTIIVKHNDTLDSVIAAIKESGYEPNLSDDPFNTEDGARRLDTRTTQLIISGLFLAIGYIFQYGFQSDYSMYFYLLTIALGGYRTAFSGIKSLKYLSLDMNFLMTIAVIGAIFLGEWSEGATVVFLFALGNGLQAYTMEKTRQSIRELLSFWPKEALVRRNEQELTLPLADIVVGDTVIIKPGQNVPMDGMVITGETSINQASITGEAIPVAKTKGDEVFAGTINQDGYIEVEVTKLVNETTLAKIIHLVEEAQGQKAPSEQFVDVFAKYYTPIVVMLALILAIVPPLFFAADFSQWLYRSLVLLVISCPCALVISTPVAIVAGIGRAAKTGVLIKGGAYLEQLGATNVIAFDKTGTLTQGIPVVEKVISYQLRDNELVSIAASLEKLSHHPLAKAVINYASVNGIETNSTVKFESIQGKGIKGVLDSNLYYIGNRALLDNIGISYDHIRETLTNNEEQGGTCLIVADSKEVLGIIVVRDQPRPESKNVIAKLKATGVKSIVMLTGDNKLTAQTVASGLGVDLVEAELLPEQKLEAIRKLQSSEKVAMVGDGVNDAPALAIANIGVAMGGAGSDTALEVADVVLMNDDLSRLPWAVNLSRRALSIIKQNICFSIVVKAIFIVLTFMGITNLWLAVFADTGTALLVIFNAMRLMITD